MAACGNTGLPGRQTREPDRLDGTCLAPTVTVSGDTATLTGTLATWLQRDSAERAAANALGIAHVDNRITVQSFHDSKMDEWDQVC
jgi:hypothetical protein